ncbi:hypothetical protein L1049_006363 [Liquidambar formosana]|uniref:SAM domain-containing protein n=1 Tax=Liquidambar formosana TaxID=63359 RepID=A0AAP0RIB8_LIQFO
MAELQPPEGPINTAPPPPPLPPPTISTAVPAAADNHGLFLAPKRQRRPSVRLGEIGDQSATLSYDPHVRRSKLWRFPKDSKGSKTRPLTNLVNGGDCHETLETEDKNFSGEGNFDFANRKSKEPKAKRGSIKRVRTNWAAAKVDDGAGAEGEGEEKFSSREDGDDGFRDFDPDDSDSPLKDQSPVHSVDNEGLLDLWHGHQRTVRARVSESRDHDGIELDGMPESNSRDRKCETSADGVRTWLMGLGLGRYAPVFEIHEVDDEVLPLLTLEDLKDMGINAVGSRRKMYTAIQRLRKGFS